MPARLFLAFIALLALTACGWRERIAADAPVTPRPAFVLAGLAVSVPETLGVSESPSLYPKADIVWRGDPGEDRHAQVKALFEAAAAAAGATEGPPANVAIEVQRFHGLTQKARYATGGIYAIRFQLVLTDPATGAPLAEPREVKADLRKFGAWHATFQDTKGITEKEVVIEHLTGVLRAELGQPALPDDSETD